MKNRTIKIAALALASVIIALAGAGSAFSEDDIETKVRALAQAADKQEAFTRLSEALSGCRSYDDYDAYASELKDLLAQNAEQKNADILYYGVAQARLDQLAMLAGNNDIASGRLYMQVNEGFFNEADTYLDKALGTTDSKELKLDINFLRFLTAREKFLTVKADALFDAIARDIIAFSGDKALNKIQLDRIAKRFEERRLSDLALKLRITYASEAGDAASREIADEIEKEAEELFEKGDFKKADLLYRNYVVIGQGVFDEGTMAESIIRIADSYFKKNRFKEAEMMYEKYISSYPEEALVDYAHYMAALSLERIRDLKQAADKFGAFLRKYPESRWFDKAFKRLAEIHYRDNSRARAFQDLRAMMTDHPGREVRYYAEFLTGILYYGQEDYESALKSFELVRLSCPGSDFIYATDSLINDIENIEKGGQPSYSLGSTDTYKRWDPYTPIDASLRAIITETGKLYVDAEEVTARCGQRVEFTVENLKDVDRFGEYLYDKEDPSRLPRNIRDNEVEEDLLLIHWTGGGKSEFAEDGSALKRIWKAPEEPGSYTISVSIDDLGIIRPPDEGKRKDPDPRVLSVTVIVEK